MALMDPHGTPCTFASAAALLGVSPHSVRRWAEQGLLPVIDLGPRLRRIPLAAVQQAAEQGLRGAKSRRPSRRARRPARTARPRRAK